jgi:hypothetical protein
VAYVALALVVLGVIAGLALRRRKSMLSDAILGFARSMDKTSWYAGSRRPSRVRSAGL